MIRYVLHPGHVAGRFDGDRHYINGTRLADLYRVPMAECVIAPATDADWSTWTDPPGAIHLRPRHDGNYTLPTGHY